MNDLTLKLTFFSNEFNCQYTSQSLLVTNSNNLKHVISSSILFEILFYNSTLTDNNSCNIIQQHGTIFYKQINSTQINIILLKKRIKRKVYN